MELRIVCKYFFVLGLYLNVHGLTISNATTRITTHSCHRKCVLGQSMTCAYTLMVQNYVTLSTECLSCPHNKGHCKLYGCIPVNGVQRCITIINMQNPGPIVDACLGDTIVAELQNRMLTESTLMHWHGMYQRDTPYMDGADFITQLPMVQANEFRYTFKAEPSGTHYHHSQLAFQMMDGVQAPLIIRVPDEINPHRHLYDYDENNHVIMMQTWLNTRGLDKFMLYRYGGETRSPDALLINGLGRFEFFNKFMNRTDFMDPARFRVEKGYRYRMRLINANTLNCPVEMSIDKHDMTLISTDGYDIKPLKVKSITSYPGETYDFILHANQDENVYWMKFKGAIDCQQDDKPINQVAIIDYTRHNIDRYPKEEPRYDDLRINDDKHYNPIKVRNIPKENIIYPTDLIHDVKYEDELKEKPDFVHFMRVSTRGFKHVTVPIPQLNYISSKVGKYVILPQRDLFDYSKSCNYSTRSDCKRKRCVCEHIIQVPLNAVVELLLVNEARKFQPYSFHLHCNPVRIVAAGSFNSTLTVKKLKDMYYNGSIKKNLKTPAFKSTFVLPAHGYTIVRFKASNPGFWLFRSELEFYRQMGMYLVFKVGEHSDMLPVPEGFPVDATYVPDF